jgi:flagellar motility protein MotE (MotC chaperone)
MNGVTRFIRDLRLIPIVLIASACLLALKTADLLLDRGRSAADNAPAPEQTSVVRAMPDTPPVSPAQHSWAQQMFNFPDGGGSPPRSGTPAPAAVTPPLPQLAPLAANANNGDITGSVTTQATTEATAAAGAGGDNAKDGKDAKEAKETKDGKDGKDAKAGNDAKLPSGTLALTEGSALPSGAERAILERLAERRQQLEARARELDIREGLIEAAEKRMEAKLVELKDVEAHIAAANDANDGTEAARFKRLVTMYESMKPRDAAKIFDRLEIGVLIEVASQVNPRRMSDILAQMTPDTAERLTVELANRARLVAKAGGELPKIEGRPATH